MSPMVAAVVLALLVGGRGTVGEPTDPRPPPLTDPPPVRDEPSLSPDSGDPIAIHDCEGGYGGSTWPGDVPASAAPVDAPDAVEAIVIAVYHTHNDYSPERHAPDAADVYVHAGPRAVALVFSAHESVLWRVHADPDVRINRVVLYGHDQQLVQRTARGGARGGPGGAGPVRGPPRRRRRAGLRRGGCRRPGRGRGRLLRRRPLHGLPVRLGRHHQYGVGPLESVRTRLSHTGPPQSTPAPPAIARASPRRTACWCRSPRRSVTTKRRSRVPSVRTAAGHSLPCAR